MAEGLRRGRVVSEHEEVLKFRYHIDISSTCLQARGSVSAPKIDGEPLRLHSSEERVFGDQYGGLLSGDSDGG